VIAAANILKTDAIDLEAKFIDSDGASIGLCIISLRLRFKLTLPLGLPI